MKNICLILAVIIVVFVSMFANYNTVSDMNLSIMYTDITFKISFLTLCLSIFSLGVITGVLFMLKGFFENIAHQKRVKRQLEKAVIGADDSDLRVKTLENKVKTLEIALEKSLKKDN